MACSKERAKQFAAKIRSGSDQAIDHLMNLDKGDFCSRLRARQQLEAFRKRQTALWKQIDASGCHYEVSEILARPFERACRLALRKLGGSMRERPLLEVVR